MKKITGEDAPFLNIGDVIVKIDPVHFRPSEVHTLLGDASKARSMLGWQPEITIEELCEEMVSHDLADAKKIRLIKDYKFES